MSETQELDLEVEEKLEDLSEKEKRILFEDSLDDINE